MSPVTSAAAAAVVLALAASSAHAGDPIYKSIMPDGRVLYGEVPVQGAKRGCTTPSMVTVSKNIACGRTHSPLSA